MMTLSNGHFFRVTGPLRGIHRSPVNSPRKGQWRRAMVFSLICGSINVWVNNRTQYDVIVIYLAVHQHSRKLFKQSTRNIWFGNVRNYYDIKWLTVVYEMSYIQQFNSIFVNTMMAYWQCGHIRLQWLFKNNSLGASMKMKRGYI